MRKLEAQEKALRYHEARLDGRRVHNIPPAPGSRLEQLIHDEEQKTLKRQAHTRVSQMTPEERSALEREQEQLWASIPPRMREKARSYLEEPL